MSAPYTDGTRTWSNRYYADLNTPCGYYDLAGLSTLANVPDPDKLFALSDAQWTARMNGNSVLSKAVVNGIWQDYTAPAVLIPMKTQAVTAQAWVQQQANLAAAMGEVFTVDMKSYVLAINAIANGTDTTSTALPAQPTDVLAASAATA